MSLPTSQHRFLLLPTNLIPLLNIHVYKRRFFILDEISTIKLLEGGKRNLKIYYTGYFDLSVVLLLNETIFKVIITKGKELLKKKKKLFNVKETRGYHILTVVKRIHFYYLKQIKMKEISQLGLKEKKGKRV